MVEQIVGFRAESNLRAFRPLEALLNRQIKLGEPGSAQNVSSRIAELTGSGYGKCIRIKPARRIAYPTVVWTSTRVRVADKVWPFRSQQGLQICIVKRKYWSKRDVAVNAGNRRDLPAAKD